MKREMHKYPYNVTENETKIFLSDQIGEQVMKITYKNGQTTAIMYHNGQKGKVVKNKTKYTNFSNDDTFNTYITLKNFFLVPMVLYNIWKFHLAKPHCLQMKLLKNRTPLFVCIKIALLLPYKK